MSHGCETETEIEWTVCVFHSPRLCRCSSLRKPQPQHHGSSSDLPEVVRCSEPHATLTLALVLALTLTSTSTSTPRMILCWIGCQIFCHLRKVFFLCCLPLLCAVLCFYHSCSCCDYRRSQISIVTLTGIGTT